MATDNAKRIELIKSEIENACLTRQAYYELRILKRQHVVATIQYVAKQIGLSIDEPHNYVWLWGIVEHSKREHPDGYYLELAVAANSNVVRLRRELLRLRDVQHYDPWVVYSPATDSTPEAFFCEWEEEIAVWQDVECAAVFSRAGAYNVVSCLGDWAIAIPLVETLRSLAVND